MNEPTRRPSGASRPGTGILAGRARTARARARAANSNDTTGSASASGPFTDGDDTSWDVSTDGPTEGDDASWDVSTSTPAESTETSDAPGAVGADGAAEEGDWFLGMRVHPVDPHHLIQVVAAVVVIVVVAAVGSTTAYRLVHSRDNRDPHPWETSVASNYTPPATTPTPSVTPGAGGSVLSQGEQALREAALAMPAPERPAGMDEFTPEGARAAAEYFLALYPYVYATGDLSTWQAMSDPDCTFCHLVIERVSALHEENGWGDPWSDEVTAQNWGYDASGEIIAIEVSVSSPERTIHYAGQTQVWAEEQARLQMQMMWTEGGWSVYGCATL